jgi:hypothetical protein
VLKIIGDHTIGDHTDREMAYVSHEMGVESRVSTPGTMGLMFPTRGVLKVREDRAASFLMKGC